jgi:recombination protein RecT
MSEQTRQLATSPANTLKALFEAAKGKLCEVVPKHVSADRLMRVALMTISRQPSLAACTPASLLGAFMQAGQYGLEVGGALGEAYLVPYRNNKNGTSEAQFIMGYRGMILLARRSGEISTIHADVVRDGDAYSPPEFTIDEKGPRITFSHKHTAPATARIIAAYAVVTFKDGGYQLDVMTRDELDGIRARSKASSSGPWVTDFAEMAKKTVIRRLAKRLPLTPEAVDAIEQSDRNEFGDMIDGVVVQADAAGQVAERQTRTKRLAEKLAATPEAEPTPLADDLPHVAPAESAPAIDITGQAPPTAPVVDESHLTDWPKFVDCINEAAQSAGITPSDATAGLNRALLLVGKKSHGEQTSVEWRRSVLGAIRAGAFDWQTGKTS